MKKSALPPLHTATADDCSLKKPLTDSQAAAPVKPRLTEKQKRQIRLIRKASGVLDYFILLISLVALFIGMYAFWDTNQVMSIADSEEYAMYKPDSTSKLSFNELQQLNPDVCAWLEVYGTEIDYPVVQGKDNSEYLNKTVLGTFSTAGSIFLDNRNTRDFSDAKNILYGHYMAERKMFGDLELFQDEKFFQTHKYGLLQREKLPSLGIEFIAFFRTVGTDQMVLSPAKALTNPQELLDYIYAKATYKRELDSRQKPHLLIMDTCDFSITNGRHILVGQLTDQTQVNTFNTGKVKKGNNFSRYLSKVKSKDLLPAVLGIWLLLGAALIISAICRREQQRRKEKKLNEAR